MKKIAHPLLILIILFPPALRAFPDIHESLAIDRWEILYHESDDYDSVKKAAGWEDALSPLKIRAYHEPEDDFQHLWLRSEFRIDDPEKYYGISFGRIHHTYKIYINDYLLDYKSPGEVGNLHLPVNFILPRDTLKKGANEIYLRLGIYRYEWGGLPDGVKIQPKKDYRLLKNWHDLLYNQLPMGILMLLFIGIVRMLVHFFMDRREKFFLYAALLLLVNSVYIITIFSPCKLVSFGNIPSILILSGPSFGILFILIIQSLYRVKLHEYNTVIFIIILLAASATLFIQKYTQNFHLKSMIGIVSVSLVIPYINYMVYRLNKIKPDMFKFFGVLILANSMAVSGLIEIIFYMTGSVYSLLIATYFSPVLILGFTMLGTHDYQNRIIDLRVLYEKLVEQKRQVRRHAITDSTGEKIEEIIEFINENYKSDISREGLASAAGMNPNYFSSQFREYTGKKIGDYINELRIRDAAEMLKDKEARIIDVALSAGFDSLSTFNRLFKNIIGKSPTEFRRGR